MTDLVALELRVAVAYILIAAMLIIGLILAARARTRRKVRRLRLKGDGQVKRAELRH